ncbi:MAG: hypothetical protein U0Q03_07835 [Acidimicrobiales bacterium]
MHPVPDLPSSLSRRRLLALGGAVTLGALGAFGTSCSSDDDADDSGSSDATSGSGSNANGTDTTDGFVVVQRFPGGKMIAPGEIRLAVSLATSDGSLLTEGPEVLNGVMRNEEGLRIDTIAAPRRGTGLGVPYWSITTTIPKVGLYDITFEGAAGDPVPFYVYDPSEITLPYPGVPLPAFDTPTVDDARGVDPICSRTQIGQEVCPFHEVTLTDALASGKPVVYLIGTPAHCQTATCGPGLDFLIDVAKELGDRAVFVHAEVYADADATEIAPAVTEYGLDYEPVIWVTDATGKVVRRIDIVWDEDELREMLSASIS